MGWLGLDFLFFWDLEVMLASHLLFVMVDGFFHPQWLQDPSMEFGPSFGCQVGSVFFEELEFLALPEATKRDELREKPVAIWVKNSYLS